MSRNEFWSFFNLIPVPKKQLSNYHFEVLTLDKQTRKKTRDTGIPSSFFDIGAKQTLVILVYSVSKLLDLTYGYCGLQIVEINPNFPHCKWLPLVCSRACNLYVIDLLPLKSVAKLELSFSY